MNHFSILIRLLRDRRTFLDEVRSGTKLESKIVSLLVSSSVFFAVYGAIIGAYSGPFQIISSAIKLPALYLLTLLICLPTLYFFRYFVRLQARLQAVPHHGAYRCRYH